MDISEFEPLVSPYVPGAPRHLVRRHAVIAAREFFSRTHAWEEDLPTIETDGLDGTMVLVLDDEIDLCKLVRVYVNGAAAPHEIVSPRRGRDLIREKSGRQIAFTTDLRSVEMWPRPVANSQVEVRAAIQPSRTALEIDDSMFFQYGNDIANGAIASLLLLPNVEWSNQRESVAFSAKFIDRIHSIAAATSFGNGAGPTRPLMRDV